MISALVLLVVSCQSPQRPAPEATAIDPAQLEAEHAVRVQRHLDDARSYWEEEQYTEALASVKGAIALEPRSAEAWQLQRELVPAATASAREARTGNVRATAEARTARAEATREAQRSAAAWIDPRELARDPDAHRGKPVMIQGTAMSVNQYLQYTMVLLRAQVPGRALTEPVVVELRPKHAELQDQECLRVTGIVFGTKRVVSSSSTLSVPHVNAIAWEPGPPGASATSCPALAADPGNPAALAERPRGPATLPLQVVTGSNGQTAALVSVHVGASGPFSFILDTGASRSVISTQIANELGLPVSGTIGPVRGVGGVVARAPVTEVTQWRMGNVALPPTELVILDLGGGRGPDGLLGSDVLSHFGTVNVDFSRGVLVLMPS
jgi:hypothetical protein